MDRSVMKKIMVLVWLAAVFAIIPSTQAKEKEDRGFPYYVDPADGWEFGFFGKQVRFDEARRYVDVARQPLVASAIKMFGIKGLFYWQVYNHRDKLHFGCYLNPNGHVLKITKEIGMTVRFGHRRATSEACFLVDSIRFQDWMWSSVDPRARRSITLDLKTIEKLEHSSWNWVYVFVMFDKEDGFEGISDIKEVVNVTGVQVKERGALLSPVN